jgi:hypothetical protein
MLAEKFFLVLETIISRTYPDRGPIVVSASRHVPIKLPRASARRSCRAMPPPPRTEDRAAA